MGEDNQREHFRILYWAPDQPLFICNLGKFFVVDISEGGFRFAIKKGILFLGGSPIEGAINFPSKRGSVFVKGKILRVFEREIAVHLDVGWEVPLSKIMEEQRAMINKGKI